MKIDAVRVIALEAPSDTPVRTSFGTMLRRRAILVRIETDGGVHGWGESWVNFPAWSYRERCDTIAQGLVPLLLGRDPREVAFLHGEMVHATHVLARQWGAPGPISQAISALDVALWDIVGKVVGQPLYRLWGGVARPVRVYASGLGPDDPVGPAIALSQQGVRTFKLKVGFGRERDEANLALLRGALGEDAELLVDANQAWDLETAEGMLESLACHRVRWLEEPLPADDVAGMARLRPLLRARGGMRLAAGENVYGMGRFAELISCGAVDVVQPDVTKMGGFTEALRVCGLASAFGVPFAPHFLGSAVGLMASLHLVAAAPGGAMLELDANPNALRDELGGAAVRVEEGHLRLPTGPGLGWEPPAGVLERYAIAERVVR